MTRPAFDDTWLLDVIDEPPPVRARHAARRRAFARARRPVAVAMRLLAAWLAGRSSAPADAGSLSPPPALPSVSPRRPAGLRDEADRAALRTLLDFPDTVRIGLDKEPH
ncbi:MAG: hypothetical protein ACTHL8_22855 [Burkholderiaceae bacterium]